MKRKYNFLALVLLLACVLGGISGRAQPAPPRVTVVSTDSLGIDTYYIEFEGGEPAPMTVVGIDAVRSAIRDFMESGGKKGKVRAAFNEASNSDDSGGGVLGNAWNGIKDDIDSELENILKEGVSDIMNGIKESIINFVTSLIDSTPITEVSSMKRLLKEAYSKQQKVEYQDYKVRYAEMKSQTELSSSFVKYYNAVDLKKQIDGFSSRVDESRKLANTRFFTSAQKQSSKAVLDKIGDTDGLVEDVKTACNLNNGGVYMSEADRVKIIDAARVEIQLRQGQLARVNSFLSQVYTARVSAYSRQEQVRGMYAPGSTLNRSIFAEDNKLTP